MRSFNANFITEKNKRGAAPVNLLKFDFSTPKYISDRDVTPSGGSAHSGLLSEWGFIDTSIKQTPGRGVLGSIDIPDLALVVINSESTPFSDKFTTADPPENVTVILYQWFEGLADSEKEEIFKGVVVDVDYDLYSCRLLIRGIFTKYDKLIGEDLILRAADFSSADPDDIGKMRNIAYGDLSNVLCRAVKAGAIDTLRDDLTDSATSFYASGGGKADFPAGTVTIQIDDEQIQGTYSQSTKQFTSCTRGYNSTTAVAHTKSASVAEVLTEYIYEAASHPVKSIGDVRVDDVKQTSGYTGYTGQTGDELTGYEDTAVIKFTALPKLVRQVNLDVDEDAHSHDGTDQTVTWYFDTGTAYAGSPLSPEHIADGNIGNVVRISTGDTVKIEQVAYQSWPGTPSRYRLCVRTGSLNGSTLIVSETPTGYGPTYTSDNTTYRATWADTTDSWATWMNKILYARKYAGANSLYVCEVWYEFEVDNDTQDATTGISLAGNSSAETVIGKAVTVDLEGYQDDGSGTYTGTPSALIERPDHVFKHLWCVVLGAPSGDIDSTSFTSAGTFYNTNSYDFALLINKTVRAEDLFMKLALQCRSRFLVTAYGKAKLIVRQLSQSSGHAIAKNEIKMDSVKIRRSPVDELINYFNIHYDRDHGTGKNDADSYAAVKKFSDATSISRYGQKEWKGREDIFFFDAVTDATMVSHVGNFLLDYHEVVRKIPVFSLFLDNMETEPGDIIDVTHDLDAMSGFDCEVLKMLHRLGSAKKNVIDHIEVVAVEN